MKLTIPIIIELTYPSNHEKCEEILSRRGVKKIVYIDNSKKISKTKSIVKMDTGFDEVELAEMMYHFLN